MMQTFDQASATSKSDAPVVIEIPEGMEQPARTYVMKRYKELSGFQNLLDQSAYEEIRIMSHNWKGTGTPFGFPEITRLGAAIERAAKERDLPDVVQHAVALFRYVQSAIQQLPPLP